MQRRAQLMAQSGEEARLLLAILLGRLTPPPFVALSGDQQPSRDKHDE